MKLFFYTFSILFTFNVIAQVPNYVPTNGLVGWWPFNGNANDESGNGNNGTVNGATLTTDRFGNTNQAYSFDGVDDKIISSIINQPSLTVSIWYNTIYPNNYYPLLIGFNQTRFIEMAGNHPAYISNANVGHLGSYPDAINSLPCIPSYSQWHHVVVIHDHNSNSHKIYINNSLCNSGATTGFLNFLNGNVLFGNNLTGNINGGGSGYMGLLDDIGIWNRALTECEIADLYNAQLGSLNSTSNQTQTACNSYTWNGTTYTQSGQYSYLTSNTYGCDSTANLNLTINNSSSATQNQSATDSYTWPVNGQTYTQSGMYTATIPNAAGCDSTITLDLTLNFTGINENENNKFSIYPNPSNDFITIKTETDFIGKEYVLFDAVGKKIKSGILTSENTIVNLMGLSEGIYTVSIEGKEKQSFRIIKE